MKSVKKWILILGISGPVVATLSCSGAFLQAFRDAAIDGAAGFVEETTFDLLDQAVSLGQTDE